MLLIRSDEALLLVVVALITFMAPIGFIVFPIWKRWARRLEAGTTEDRALREELEEMRTRVMELEERVDYSERLLTQMKEPGRLPGEVR